MADDAGLAEKQFLYDAFISYRHVDRDRKWAEWLIGVLEGYRVPKALQERGLPPRLRKVFRDEDELPSSADLNDQIREALGASRFLIVVCSAFTPRSKWVEREIQVFNELGRGDQVLALLTEGEPGDSFPDAMLVRYREVFDPDGSKRTVKEDKEPLAADVRPRPGVSNETLKRLALLRLVAVILGVNFDDLRQREQQREHKRHLTWGAIAAALFVLVGGGGGLYWDMMRPKATHYRHLAWRWGVPEGVAEIDEATRSHLEANYSVIMQRSGLTEPRRVIEVRRENSAGTLVDDGVGMARWLVLYEENGLASKIEVFSETERLHHEEVFKRGPDRSHLVVAFERNTIPLTQAANENLVVDSLNEGLPENAARGEITRHELIFDHDGLAVEVRYQDDYGTARHNAQGSFGEHYSYSPDGLVLRRAEIGPDGNEITLKDGVRAATFVYDRDASLVRFALVGTDGRPAVGVEGYAHYDRQNDPWGNEAVTSFYNVNGKPTVHKNGYAVLRRTFSEAGNVIAIAFLDVNDSPTLHQLGMAKLTNEYDSHGRVIRRAYFDRDGKPALTKDGYAAFTRSLDVRGNIVEEKYFGIDGRPTLQRNGSAIFRRKFDQHGNLVEVAYLDTDAKPTFTRDGYAGYRQTFNTRDQRTAIAYFDPAGRPTLSKEGIARISYSYDVHGNEVDRAFFGVDGKAVLGPQGIAGFHKTFDERGNESEVSYRGLNGPPALARPLNAAQIRYAYDLAGNLIEFDMFGVDGKPTTMPGGAATIRRVYDQRGNAIETSSFGVDGKPAATFEGTSRSKSTFDSLDHEIERRFFGVDGKPTAGGFGDAGFREAYDERGNRIEEAYFGLNDKPIVAKLGYATVRAAYDDRHHMTEQSYFGLDGKPTLSQEKIAKIVYSYDTRGNQIERAFFGVDGKPTLDLGGFAAVRQTFDDRSNVVTASYYDISNKLTVSASAGYAMVRWAYNARGDLTEESYFDAEGRPAQYDGCVTIRYGYDNVGQQTKVTYLDADNHELHMAVVVRRIVPGGNAARAGLANGDRVLSYDGWPVTSVKQLTDLLTGIGFRKISVQRGSQVLSFDVIAGNLGAFLGLARIGVEPPANAGEVPPGTSVKASP